jgi:hypothetical protein
MSCAIAVRIGIGRIISESYSLEAKDGRLVSGENVFAKDGLAVIV